LLHTWSSAGVSTEVMFGGEVQARLQLIERDGVSHLVIEVDSKTRSLKKIKQPKNVLFPPFSCSAAALFIAFPTCRLTGPAPNLAQLT